jgi:hypothetical protein
MSKFSRAVISQKSKTYGTPISHKGFAKSLKPQQIISQFMFDVFLQRLRKIEGFFGLRLIRGVANLKQTAVDD